tara:strand:+ start:23547 stop:24374 length:828 start_codon:yes stop_codon:yes gene_type:complete
MFYLYKKRNLMANRQSRRPASSKSSRRVIKEELSEFINEADSKRQEEYKSNLENSVKDITINKNIKCKTLKQKQLIKTIRENEIIFVRGAAGTGKTFIALKAALETLKKEDNPYQKILLSKPIIEAQNNKLGFLPGSMEDKIDPYMDSYMTNIKLLIGDSQARILNTGGIIGFNPLPYMRGATFMNSIAILDEAQNVTVGGMKLFISRKHETCKLIVLGDEDQTDLSINKNERNGLQDAFERFQGLKNVGFVTFTEDDIVRSSILIEVMKRYKIQ